MSKSKKVVQLQSPENYIKTRARNLPIGKCYISSDWENIGIANILISRKHVNGNFTFGYYLVDLLCLGIKDTFFRFNEGPDEMEHWIVKGFLQEVDYVLVHNIIYGAEAFAEDYGFKPHKDWKTTQFILEADDDEAIELMDIEFGRAGKPVYVAGPYDDQAKINRILATLERYAGPNNYDFVSDLDEEDDWDDELEDEEDNLFEEGEIERILNGEQHPTLHQQYAITVVQYAKLVEDTGSPIVDPERIEAVEENLIYDNRYTEDDDLEDSIWAFEEEHEEIFGDISVDALPQLEQLLAQYPENPYTFVRLFLLYKEHGQHDRARNLAERALQLFPAFLYFRFLYAFANISEGRLEEGLELLGGKYYMDDAFPLQEEFSEGEFVFFHTALCLYFTAKGDIPTAVCYANAIVEYADEYGVTNNAVILLCSAMADDAERKSNGN